jgi:hypothetical protein
MKPLKFFLVVMAFGVVACGGSDSSEDEPIIDPVVTPTPETPNTPTEPSTSKLHSIKDSFSSDMIYSFSTLQTKTAVMQSFDIDTEKNTIYYTQINNKFRVYVSWGGISVLAPDAHMTLLYSGHGSNFSIEKVGSARYIWISNYGSKNASGDYWSAQIISRILITKDATLRPSDATDNYYFGEKNIAVSVNVAADRLAILGISSGLVRIYKLSQLQALSQEKITLEPITYGGEAKAPDAETTYTPEVMARDCRKVEPIGSFTIARTSGVSWQGFDVTEDRFYQAQGNGNNNDNVAPSAGYILIFKHDGTVVQPATLVEALNDMSGLNTAGLTDTGYMEPEGVKIKDDVMYCGYAAKNSQDERRGAIFKFSPDPVE